MTLLPSSMTRYLRKVIRIRAEDSPNVRRARFLLREYPGIERSRLLRESLVVPGVLTFEELETRRATWDPIRQCIGLDAEFYSGPENLLLPKEWLDEAERRARELGSDKRKGKALGIDPGEGGDNTAWAIVDENGLIHLESYKTPDTSAVTARTIALVHEYGVPPEKVVFDRGGGGKEHADRLRLQGFGVQTVAFGESILPDIKRGITLMGERKDVREEKTAYKNRRAELYGTLREILDPSLNEQSFGLPAKYTELRRQLSLIPLTYDSEGRLMLLPKNAPLKDNDIFTAKKDKKTLVGLLGHSPDEADALVLAIYGLVHKSIRAVAGAR